MGFFSNKSVNYLNLHNGSVELLTQIVFIFGSVFLYQHGFSIKEVFLTLGVMAAGRIATRLLSLPLIRIFGLRKTVAIGLTGYGASVSMLSQVQGIDGWFIAYMSFYVLFNPIYWLGFHIYYTLMSEEQHRGKQYAMRSAIILGGQALFPIVGALIIKWLGYPLYFALCAPITITGLTLLLFCPDAEIPRKSWVWSRKQLFSVGIKTSIFRSFYDMSYNTLWMFVIFTFWGNKLVPLGGLITFGIILQVLWQLLIGKRLDSGHASRIADIGGTMMLITIIARIFSPLSLPVILVIELCNAVARLHINSVIDIATYNDSHRAEHIVWYWVFTEMTRDTGNILGTGTVAFLLYKGVDIRTAMLMALPALLILWCVLKHIIAKRSL